MTVKEAIQKRRSIRKYQNKEIPAEIIDELLEAARWAPSARNVQPWAFKVVTGAEDKAKLKENHVFMRDFVYDAPAIIICCVTEEDYPKDKFQAGMQATFDKWSMIDIGLATENILLQATELGLGGCVVGMIDMEKIKSVLNIPEKYFIPYVVPIGYPDETPAPTPRKSLEEITMN
ncbi:MAG: nitroreductase family protein [Patescibacteria group bacterium]|nr:nitroreductase family protein [Patescibacteria group bacterium]